MERIAGAPGRGRPDLRRAPLGGDEAGAGTGRPSRADGAELPRDDEKVGELAIRSAVVAPITVAGRQWGVVRAASTREQPLPSGAERRLGDFAELVAQAIANADAREQLAASRARIVEASDAARRRIERNLHDGAQAAPGVAGAVGPTGRARLKDHPEAGRVLGQVADELAPTLAELRELAREIHPTVLTSHGLSAALQALVARAPVSVELRATPSERLPEAIEATAYYLVAESLTNVAKYATATAATVSAAAVADRLIVEARDDGVGGANIQAGSGLRGLSDRVEAVRRRLHIESPAGRGTVITATIPIDTAPALD